MAHLSDNGLYTIEYGSSAWRSILNDNISKTITETKLNNGITTNINLTGDISQTGNYNLTGDITQTGDYNLNGNLNLSGNLVVGGTTLTTHLVTAEDDIKFTDENKGVVLKDRSDGHFYRIYVDNGACDVEQTTTPTSTLDVVDIFGDNSGVALYQLDDNTNDTGGQYDGTPTDITYDTGKFSDGAVFNGSSSKIENTSLDISSYSAVTFSFWLSTTTTSSGSLMGFSGNNDMAIQTSNGTTCRLYFRSNTNYTDVSNFFVNDGTWHHYAFVIDSNGTNHYKDGSSVTTTSQALSGVTTTFDIGNVTDSGGNNSYFNGKIDQVRIFNRTLTDDEINQLYNES